MARDDLFEATRDMVQRGFPVSPRPVDAGVQQAPLLPQCLVQGRSLHTESTLVSGVFSAADDGADNAGVHGSFDATANAAIGAGGVSASDECIHGGVVVSVLKNGWRRGSTAIEEPDYITHCGLLFSVGEAP